MDFSQDSFEEKLERGRLISDQIDRENNKHANIDNGISVVKMLTIIVFAILVIMIFASESNADNLDSVEVNDKTKMVIVGATSSGMAIWEKAPDYDSLRIHYLDLVSESMEKLNSDSLNQETVVNEITNIALQSVFANRLPETITPYNMISIFTDDPVLRTNLINLVSNTVWLRQDNSMIVMYDNRRFNLIDGQWYYIANEAEIRPVDYDELICLVMGVDYVAPDLVKNISVLESMPEIKSSLPGFSTVEP